MNRSVLLVAILVLTATAVVADSRHGPSLSAVPSANQKAAGFAPAPQLSPELRQIVQAQGSMPLENPEGIIGWYGYENDAPSPDGATFPQMVPGTRAPLTEAQKTEPDKNTVDGSTWDPFAQRLLFTTENANAPTYAATATFPSEVEDVSGALGRGGYEGIQNDSAGNVWIVEDIGGANKPGTVAKIPNSFVYRYVPRRPGDLHNGRLQVLQVLNALGQPITVESQTALCAPDQVALRTFGRSFDTRWITIHDTAVDGKAPFNANTRAKAAHGTPFKRPENGVFRPGSNFREFFFDETGDTNALSAENGGTATSVCTAGGWTSIFRLTQSSPSADQGRISLFFEGNAAVAGLDNIQFLSRDLLISVEDAGDTLHTQRNALDSGFVFDVDADYSTGAQPIRWIAQGRDPSATLDAANGGFGKNDGDNEITGPHVSDGDPTSAGILGAKIPEFGHDGWRWFWTQQHGDNFTFEVLPARSGDDDRGRN